MEIVDRICADKDVVGETPLCDLDAYALGDEVRVIIDASGSMMINMNYDNKTFATLVMSNSIAVIDGDSIPLPLSLVAYGNGHVKVVVRVIKK